jgi:valyl-tRNA synthetase
MNSELSKTYEPKKVEGKIYKFWEKGGWFTPKIVPRKKPFTILLPLPNANDPLHMGHVLFAVEDIIIRYYRMRGRPTLWLPGGDHAGIETQFVFEKRLAKEGKSRFDFGRKTLYKMISEFVEKNKNINREQLKKLGFSLDWTRYHYSLEPNIVKIVFDTFRKLHRDGLIYRGERIVNFCTKCGTAFSDLEVDYVEKDEFLYYLDYTTLQIATTRPETIFADVAVAVNPTDKRYKNLIGKKAVIPLINKEVPIIADKRIDVNFGTGVLKVTPGHDTTDYEIGQTHNLETITIIDKNGRMTNLPEKYLGLTVKTAREKTINDLEKAEKLVKTEPLKHSIGICYRCKTTIEPLIMPQWFLKIGPLAKPALEAVEKERIKIIPEKRFKKMYLNWMRNVRDWNIGRQIVWGPQIPVWYCLDCNPDILINFINKKGNKINGTYKDLKDKYNFAEIKKGLQSLSASKNPVYSLEEKACQKCKGKKILQETDTFDTWFLSGQWPLTTLGYQKSKDFKYFYPTSVLDTLWDILFFWVARMIMFGLYLTKEVPFKIVHIHCRVVDENGQKMSKSKGNVLDPMDMVQKYGADALRMSVIFGTTPGTDICISDNKIRGMRNFANKIWNASRFVLMNLKGFDPKIKPKLTKKNKKILRELNSFSKEITKLMDSFKFYQAAEKIYHYFWHIFCDKIIEEEKSRLQGSNKKEKEASQYLLLQILKTNLELLHPFIPFITEEIYQKLPIKNKKKCLMIENWPV